MPYRTKLEDRLGVMTLSESHVQQRRVMSQTCNVQSRQPAAPASRRSRPSSGSIKHLWSCNSTPASTTKLIILCSNLHFNSACRFALASLAWILLRRTMPTLSRTSRSTIRNRLGVQATRFTRAWKLMCARWPLLSAGTHL